MGIFSGCLLACDIDGTLMVNGVINPRNIEKIDFFMNEGGYFSLSTGRTVGAVGPVLSKLKKVSPSIVANGSMIYDFENRKVLDELYIPKSDYKAVKAVLESGIDAGIEAHSGEKVLTVRANAETRDHQEYEWLESEEVTFEEAAKYRWNKVVYLFSSAEDLNKVKEFVGKNAENSVFSDTSAVIKGRKREYYEQLPKGVSKGSALDKLSKILKIDKGCVFAAGDYFNDMEMLKKADISAVPEDSPEEVAACADFRAGSCEDGAVADFIDYLTDIRKGMV